METHKKIRDLMYKVQFKRWKHFININSPYTLIKSIYYIETASMFLFCTQKIIKSPNFVTLLYLIFGITGSALIHCPGVTLFYVGVFMIFTKGTFDWADGPLARRLNKTSFVGYVFDNYGAYVNDAVFRVSFAYFALKYYSDFMFLFPIIATILLLTKFNFFADVLNYKDFIKNLKKNTKKFKKSKIENPKANQGLTKIYNNYISFLDARARSTDFLLLILILDNLTDGNLKILIAILLVLIVLRSLVMHLASTYYVFKFYKETS